MHNELLSFKDSTHTAFAILSVAVVFVPNHHALRVSSMQQRLHRRIKKRSHGTLALALVGMLCAVRHPLTPIDCIFLTRYMQRKSARIMVGRLKLARKRGGE